MRYFARRKARIEIVPMIDIMLFLLVFFIMMTLHMIPGIGLPSRLPASTSSERLERPQILIGLDADGAIRIAGQPVSLAELTARLGAADPAARVLIAGAEAAALGDLVAVMDACRHAGLTQIGLAARGPDA